MKSHCRHCAAAVVDVAAVDVAVVVVLDGPQHDGQCWHIEELWKNAKKGMEIEKMNEN
jgi:very-short-patch-repair endonuclease